MHDEQSQPDRFLSDGVRFLREFFDLSAEKYGPSIEPAFAPLVDSLLDFAGSVASGQLVDLGAGTGLVARALQRQGMDAIAVDLSRRMLSAARGSNVGQVVQADMHRLPFPEGAFQVALASFAFNSTDPAVSFGEAFRILGDGGRLVLQEWGSPDELSEIVSDTFALYAVDDPPPEVERLRWGTEQPAPWDELETVESIGDAVTKAGLHVDVLSVVDAEVRFTDLDQFLRYKLAWPSRQAEVRAMPAETRQLMFSDLRENLTPQLASDGSLRWHPQVIRISAHKDPDGPVF